MLLPNQNPEGSDSLAKKETSQSIIKQPYVSGYEKINPNQPVTIFTELAEGLTIITQNGHVRTIPTDNIEWRYDD